MLPPATPPQPPAITVTAPTIDWRNPELVTAFKQFIFSRTLVEVEPGRLEPYEPHVGQQPVHFPEPGEEWKVYVASAGQRAGKSIAAAEEITWRIGQPGQRMWIVAPTYDLANKVFDQAYAFLVQQQVYGPDSVKIASGTGVKKGSQRIEMAWGSWVETKSAENPDSLVGEKLTFLVLDEAAQLPQEIWEDFLEPRLVTYKGDALIITSPRGFNWVWKFWQRGHDPETRAKGWRSGKFQTTDNPWVDREFVEQKRLLLPATTFAEQYLGEFEAHSGLVYPDYRDDLFPKGHLFDPNALEPWWTHYRAIDVGARHPTACNWGAVDKREWLHVYAEYEETGRSHQEHARQILALTRYPVEDTWISPDAKRTNPLTADGPHLSAYDIYCDAGIYPNVAHDDFSAGWSLVTQRLRATLQPGVSHPGLLISVNCMKLRRHMMSYVWQDQRPQRLEGTKKDAPDRPRKYKDDLDDAFRYLVAGRPYYIQPARPQDDEDYDPRGREGFRVGGTQHDYVRPGVDF